MCLVYLCESAVFCMCMDWNTCVCMGAVRRDIVQGSFDFDQHDIRNQFYRARGIRYACESACFAINGRNHTVSSSDDTYSTVQQFGRYGCCIYDVGRKQLLWQSLSSAWICYDRPFF